MSTGQFLSRHRSIEYNDIALLQHFMIPLNFLELLVQVDYDLFNKLFKNGDWSDPEAQRKGDSNNNELKTTEDP